MDLPPDAISRRALSFVRTHGHRIPRDRVQQSAARWTEQGADATLVQRAAEFQERWGDLYLPPSMLFEGGPKYLGPDVLGGRWADGGYVEAGPARVSLFYDFLLDANGIFGIGSNEFVPLYSSVENWIESVALEYELCGVATEIRKLKGPDVQSLDLSSMSPFPGIYGISEKWMIDSDRVILLSKGISLVSGHPDDVSAIIYSGISDRVARLGIGFS